MIVLLKILAMLSLLSFVLFFFCVFVAISEHIEILYQDLVLYHNASQEQKESIRERSFKDMLLTRKILVISLLIGIISSLTFIILY